MRIFDPSAWSGRDVLLVAPHADDEVFGCGGLVHQLSAADNAVRVVVVARGDGGITGGVTVEEREEESLRGCQALGIGQPVFARIPSTELRDDPAAAGRSVADLAGIGRFDLLLVPSPLERHDTHRACLVAALLSGAARATATWWGYGVWDAIPATEDTIEIDVTGSRGPKTLAMTAHVTQNRDRNLAPAVSSRDLAQAVFSKITGHEPRRAVERLLDLTDLARDVPGDAKAVRAMIRGWLLARSTAWTDALWGEPR